jgi:hypothetical protein
MQRRRSGPNKPSFDDRITQQKAALEKQLLNHPEGPKREEIEIKLKRLDEARRMNAWLSSPGLKSPK